MWCVIKSQKKYSRARGLNILFGKAGIALFVLLVGQSKVVNTLSWQFMTSKALNSLFLLAYIYKYALYACTYIN